MDIKEKFEQAKAWTEDKVRDVKTKIDDAVTKDPELAAWVLGAATATALAVVEITACNKAYNRGYQQCRKETIKFLNGVDLGMQQGQLHQNAYIAGLNQGQTSTK